MLASSTNGWANCTSSGAAQGRKFYLSPFEVKLSSHIQGEEVCKEHCELGMRQISVDPQGYLYPCVQFTAAGPGEPLVHRRRVTAGIDEPATRRLRESRRTRRNLAAAVRSAAAATTPAAA